MESIKFHDIGAEKANAISKYLRVQRFTTLFRFVEVFVFLIVLSRFTTQFSFSLKISSACFRGISITLISTKFIFVIGNVIVIALILISGQFSSKTTDLYDEYVEKCRNHNPQVAINKGDKRSSNTYSYRSSACSDDKKIIRRVQSANLVRAEARRHGLRRSASEKCGQKAANEMSSEEFRQTVEAFIERQQRFLREEEEEEEAEQFPSMLSFHA